MRLLVIEDELDMASALRKGLRQQGYAVDIALDGWRGWDMAEVNDYDLLLLDLNLPEMDGLEVCRQLRVSKPWLLILMLTARGRIDERSAGLDLGADDYLVKPFAWQELVSRVRALLRRDMRARPPLLEWGDLRFDQVTRSAWQGERPLDLTNKELGILEYLMRHQTETVSQEDLLEHVWGEEVNPFTNTVRTHINGLRRKLGDGPNGSGHIRTVVGKGYCLHTPTDLEAVS